MKVFAQRLLARWARDISAPQPRRNRSLRFEQFESRALLAAGVASPLVLERLQNPPVFQNRSSALDVNFDRVVDARDALLLADKLPPAGERTKLSTTGPVDKYWDVSGDGYLSPIDRDLVLQHLAEQTLAWQRLADVGSVLGGAAAAAELGEGEGGGITIELIAPGPALEGTAFTLFGTVSPAGYHWLEGSVDWSYSIPWPIETDENGLFQVGVLVFDDGGTPGNGTPSDVEPIAVTLWPVGEPELAASDSTQVTVHNVNPVLDITFFNPLAGGPEWCVAGTVLEEGDTTRPDVQIVTIDWGDGSPPTVLTGLLPGDPFEVGHTYLADGSAYTVTVTALDDDTGTDERIFGFEIYHLDLDNDADNNGEIEAIDDPIENIEPGAYLMVNDNDSNLNEVIDLDEAPVSGELDLEKFKVVFVPATRPDIDNYNGWIVRLSYLGEPEEHPIWTTAEKSGQIVFAYDDYENLSYKDWIVGTDIIPTELFLEARWPGVFPLNLDLYRDLYYYGDLVDRDAVVFTALPRPKVDLDTDSDNTGTIEGTAEEDGEEMKMPGNIIHRNWDDDDQNGVIDYNDAGPLVWPNGDPFWDNDLEPLTFAINAAGLDLTNYTITYSTDSPSIKLWKDQDKLPLTSVVTIGVHPIPTSLVVEGIDNGQFKAIATLKNPAGVVVHVDSVRITVVTIDAVAYRPQTPPFTPWPLPEAVEAAGIGIRRNGDDDDTNFIADRDDFTVPGGDNDLIQVDLIHEPANAEGVGWQLARSDTKIRAFEERDKSWWIVAGETTLVNDDVTEDVAWVEWAAIGGGSSTLEYSVWDTTHDRKVFFDSIVFTPFNSIVVMFVGEFEEPSDPPNPGTGMSVFARGEYRYSGRDVFLYDEDIVATDGSGAPYNEIVSAINTRGVSKVAAMGYSHGGGSTFHLSWRLEQNTIAGSGVVDITKPFTVPLTGYIDAIRNTFDGDIRAEDRRPRLAEFHCAQYQRTRPLDPSNLKGMPSDGEDDWNRTDLGVDHGDIDDHLEVHYLLRMRLRSLVPR
ncbi:MAG: dockerin type I domain-containing protein [Pirellulaceae bacterium]